MDFSPQFFLQIYHSKMIRRKSFFAGFQFIFSILRRMPERLHR